MAATHGDGSPGDSASVLQSARVMMNELDGRDIRGLDERCKGLLGSSPARQLATAILGLSDQNRTFWSAAGFRQFC